MHIVNVAINAPLYKLFSYSYIEPLHIGTRVKVNFANKEVVGFVWDVNIPLDTLECPIEKIKPILTVFLEQLHPDTIRLIKFCASYYYYPIGQTIFSVIPNGWRKTYTIKLKQPKLKTPPSLIPHKHQLNSEQSQIVTQIGKNINKYYPVLLYGITGSGKTEVYLELIEQVLVNAKQVLVLVPEINLTPQLLERFRHRFPTYCMYVLTSSSTSSERMLGYIAATTGEAQIIIGTRLAVFTPFKNLGLIIVDEEHDMSFKQQDSLRYHARDVAVWRAKSAGVPLLLGSATPSLETLYNYKQNKYVLLKLTKRAVGNSVLPKIKLIDMNLYKTSYCLTPIAIEAIANRIKQCELSLIFINRRGYAPIITCYDCGWVGECKNCSSSLVFHRSTAEIKCHHCGKSYKVPKFCPVCEGQNLHTIGLGTQQVEEQLNSCFPDARIYRIDQDTLNTKKAWAQLYNKINHHEIDILVGTQILAKGHDFHNLTLVVGLNIDNGLYSYDFRASEFLFTQLTQVAGRAGRGDKLGEVMLQTMYPKHELYQYLLKHDFSGFINYTMKQRKDLSLPPYTYYAMLKVSSKELAIALNFLWTIRGKVRFDDTVSVFEPVPSVLQRLKNKERGQMLISSFNRQALHIYLGQLVDLLTHYTKLGDLVWQLDIDPFEM